MSWETIAGLFAVLATAILLVGAIALVWEIRTDGGGDR